MASILDSLVAPGSAAPAVPDAGAQLPSTPAAPDVNSVLQAYPFLAAVSKGKLPGVVIPQGWKNPATKVITPDIVTGLGLIFYKPQDPKLQLSIINPKETTREKGEKLDKAGKLSNKFPSISNFVPSVDSAAPAAADASQVAAPAAPETAQAPAMSSTPVPVTAGPGMGADAQGAAAKARVNNLANTEPSQRPVAGGGIVLNSLLKRAI